MKLKNFIVAFIVLMTTQYAFAQSEIEIEDEVDDDLIELTDIDQKFEIENNEQTETINRSELDAQLIKNMLIQQQRIKEKNLTYPWRVSAQAVCSTRERCWIQEIRFIARMQDGAANFSIAYRRWNGSAGSSGLMNIQCGFNRSNTLRSTSVNANCN